MFPNSTHPEKNIFSERPLFNSNDFKVIRILGLSFNILLGGETHILTISKNKQNETNNKRNKNNSIGRLILALQILESTFGKVCIGILTCMVAV